jgi:DNA transformation protein
MRSSDSFRAFVVEQLAGVRELHARAMFGGVGLYAGDVFFGIIAADTLYLKTNDTNRAAYEEAGSKPFRPYADRAMAMPYYNVPLSVLEDADTLTVWARRAVAVARTTKAAKAR